MSQYTVQYTRYFAQNASRQVASKCFILISLYPVTSYLFEVNNVNIRTVCEICSKLTIKTLEPRH